MKAVWTVIAVVFFASLFAATGCLEYKKSAFDTQTTLSRNWNDRFALPPYDLAGGDVVRFALFTDSHQNYHDLNNTIRRINASTADFAVNLGDFTDVGTRDEYEIFHYYLRDLQIPSWVLPGNHDLATLREKLFTRVFGADNYSITTTYAKFIFWNNNLLELTDRLTPLAWLNQEVTSASSTEPVFIFQHQDPLNSLTFTDAERTQISNILGSHPQVLIFHGHLHSFDHDQVNGAQVFQINRIEGEKWAYVEFDSSNIRVFYCTKNQCDKIYETANIYPFSTSQPR